MYFFLFLLALLGAAIFFFIKYCIAYVKLRSHSAYDEAAEKKMRSLKKKDPFITCDYCGARIDTNKSRACPVCGAVYQHDEEWTSRFEVDREFVDREADAYARKQVSQARSEAAASLKKIRVILIILVSFLAFLFLLSCIFKRSNREAAFAKDELANEYSHETYAKTDIQAEQEGILYDKDGVRLQLTGFYKDEENSWKIEYRITNNTDFVREITTECLAVNGCADHSFYLNRLIKPNTEVTQYRELYYLNDESIESLVFDSVRVESDEEDARDDHYRDEAEGYIVMKTDAYTGAAPRIMSDTLFYENDKVSVYSSYITEDDDELIALSIVNKTDYYYEITDYTVRTPSHTDRHLYASYLYDDILPPRCVLNRVTVEAKDGGDIASVLEDIEVNFSFRCEEAPEADFSTGYCKLLLEK